MTAVDRVFAAVFPPLSEYNIPTPAATPVLGSAGFEGSAEAHITIDWDLKDTAAEQVQWERAWHTATIFLSLPNEQLPAINDRNDHSRLHGNWWKRCTPEVAAALKYLLSPDSPGARLRKGQKQHDLLQWYFEEAGLRHFIQHVRPRILQLLEDPDAKYGVSNVVTYLERAHTVYFHNLQEHVYPLCANGGEEEKKWILSNLTGLLTYSLPQQKINHDLSELFKMHAEASLEIQSQPSTTEQRKIPNVRRLLTRLQNFGMGGSRLQKILAGVMSGVLSAYIKQTYAGEWMSRSKVTAKLRYWVENRFARYIVEMLAPLNTGTSPQTSPETEIALSDVEKWQEIAINHLGALRTEELFNIIFEWENDSSGAIEDLKRYVTNTAARLHVTNSFCEVLGRSLLQPGAATTEILQVYISIIRAFSLLDPKCVLLDRVARPIRRYLQDRDDTAAIVVSSLLADAETSSSSDVLPELAEEMQNNTSLTAQEDDVADLDFDDMEWMPDPVDAGPDYRKSKNLDVIGSLISLFETKDIFVKEFQKVLGERLLKQAQTFEIEIRALELLKLRFGEASLQACEVMLRDIVDSRRVDHVIRIEQNKVMSQRTEPVPALHARILSHLFWPSLHSEDFFLPPEISASQMLYATGFEKLKQSRKLTWLNALGQVTVQLDLEDRSVTEVVQTWQASVIYAFQNEESPVRRGPVTKTVQELTSSLSMSESFVRNALIFWVGRLVLQPSPSDADSYHVLETLPSSALDPSSSSKSMKSTLLAAAAAADAATSGPAHALRSEEDITQEKMEVFWQFVVGMLTNQGAMPLARIVMMLKVVVPGGFPFGNEELKGFLEGRVREGKLEVVGGQYKIKVS